MSLSTPALAAADAEWTPNQPGSNLEISLITFGPGEEYWERFGHNAILVRERTSDQAYTYNYGIFDFDQSDFYLNFARGRMLYRMAARPFAYDVAEYAEEGRSIVEQRLNLKPPQRLKLLTFLEWNLRPENQQYRYDYFRNNCSTRVRDALNQALDDGLRAQSVSSSRGFTYRMDTMRLMRPEFWLMLGMDVGLGPAADQRLSFWDESFVPMTLMHELNEISVRDDAGNVVPLVANETRINNGVLPEPPNYPPNWTWSFLALGSTLAMLIVITAQQRAYTIARIVFAMFAVGSGLIFGLAGLLLIGLWAGTEHQFAWRNENVLLLNPLCLLLLPTWISAFRARWRPHKYARTLALLIAFLAGFAFFAKVLPWFAQDNRAWIALILPMHVAFAVVLWRQRSLLNRT